MALHLDGHAEGPVLEKGRWKTATWCPLFLVPSLAGARVEEGVAARRNDGQVEGDAAAFDQLVADDRATEEVDFESGGENRNVSVYRNRTLPNATNFEAAGKTWP